MFQTTNQIMIYSQFPSASMPMIPLLNSQFLVDQRAIQLVLHHTHVLLPNSHKVITNPMMSP